MFNYIFITMKKILYVAAFSMLAVSCNKDANTPLSPAAKSGEAAQVAEIYDEATNKYYKFTFEDLFTGNATYTYEVIETPDDPQDQVVAFMRPEDYQILSGTSEDVKTIKFLHAAYMIHPNNPGTPVYIAPGETKKIVCTCKKTGETGEAGGCWVSLIVEPKFVNAKCQKISCPGKCKQSHENVPDELVSGSAIFYVK